MNNIPIFLASDNNYAPYLAVTITSILANTKSFIDFYILDSGITTQNKEKMLRALKKYNNFSIEFVEINSEKYFKEFSVLGYLNLATYSRLLIPQLKPDLNKVIYMDIDIIVLGDITDLYNTDLQGFALGAAWDKSRTLYNTDTKEPMQLSDDYKYFNAGVLLIDIKKWNSNHIFKKLFEIEKEYGGTALHVDETLLNKYFDNNYKIFDIKYNYLDYDVLNSPNSDIVIRHFATPMKPWNSNFSMQANKVKPLKNFNDFWYYAKMTEFYEDIKKSYDIEINSNAFKKRMSIIVEKQLSGQI